MNKFIWSSMISVVFLSACAQTFNDKPAPSQQQIDNEVAQQPSVKGADLRKEAYDRIVSAPGLTADQRAALADLQRDISTKLDAYRDESYKLRALLIRDVINRNYDSAEVDSLKSRLKQVEKARLSVMLKAVDQTNEIFGRNNYHPNPNDTNVHQYFESMWDGTHR